MSQISGNIFRPLLSLPKQEILNYSEESSIKFHDDSTNTDLTYDRNRIRHDIIPVLESLNPSIHNTMDELAMYMQDLKIFLISQVEQWLKSSEIES